MDLQAAADRLGVHYQTAYRWVREGALRATKVGAAYVVDEDELERFLEERRKPTPPPRTTNVRSWAAQVSRLYALLVDGEELAARQQVDRLHEGGLDILTLCERLFVPALRDVGEGWRRGDLSVAHEHRASAIVERILARLAVHPRGRPRGVAVVATPPGEEHALPATMAAVVLRADRWQVHHLGAQVPVADLVELVTSVHADLVVLSVVNPEAVVSGQEAADALATTGVTTLLGRPGMSLTKLLDQARTA